MDGALPRTTPGDINYWLSMWVDVYGHLAAQIEQDANSAPSNFLPVAYEDLCTPETGVWPRVSARLGLPAGASPFRAPPASAEAYGVNADLLAAAKAIYNRLQALEIRILKSDIAADTPAAEVA